MCCFIFWWKIWAQCVIVGYEICSKILPQLDKSKHGVFPGLGGILFSKFEQVFGNDRVDLIAGKIGCAMKLDARFELLMALTSIHRTDQFLPRRSCQRVQQVYWGLICSISISSPAGQRPNWRSSRTQGSCLQRGLCSPTSTMGPWIGNRFVFKWNQSMKICNIGLN